MVSRKSIIRKDEQFADMEEALNQALASLEDANNRVQELLAREAPAVPEAPNGSVEAEPGVAHSSDLTFKQNPHE